MARWILVAMSTTNSVDDEDKCVGEPALEVLCRGHDAERDGLSTPPDGRVAVGLSPLPTLVPVDDPVVVPDDRGWQVVLDVGITGSSLSPGAGAHL
jgi:hypothetical protein